MVGPILPISILPFRSLPPPSFPCFPSYPFSSSSFQRFGKVVLSRKRSRSTSSISCHQPSHQIHPLSRCNRHVSSSLLSSSSRTSSLLRIYIFWSILPISSPLVHLNRVITLEQDTETPSSQLVRLYHNWRCGSAVTLPTPAGELRILPPFLLSPSFLFPPFLLLPYLMFPLLLLSFSSN
jgi:hypothetical protein